MSANNGNEEEEKHPRLLEGIVSTPLTAEEAKAILAKAGYNIENELADFKIRLSHKLRSPE